jgi:hypothetical protein
MIKKLAILGLAAVLALPAVMVAPQPAEARARVGVNIGIGFGWPGYVPYYPRYRYSPYRYYPAYVPRYVPRAYYPYAPYRYRVIGGTHVQRCMARYKTYNPRTDMFYARPGVLAKCRL